MYCAKCGKELQNGVDFCPQCGEKQNNSLQETENQPTPSQKKSYKLQIILLSIGAGLSLLIFLISWIAYGKVYFFNGYAITAVGWIVSFVLIGIGIVLSILSLKKGARRTNIKRQIITIVCLIAVLPVVLICSAVINGEEESSSSSSYSSSSYSNEYSQNNAFSLSTNEKESLAENEVLAQVYQYMEQNSADYFDDFSDYNISATKYKIGSITNSGNEYTVNGTLYLYDKYGSLKDTATFSGSADVDDDGSVSGHRPNIDIK